MTIPMPQPVAWVRRHPNGALTAELLEDAVISPVRKQSGAWLPMITTTQAEAYADARVAESQKWQPIETAPKDGTMILLGRKADESKDLDAVSVPGFWQEGWGDSVDDMGCDSGFVDINFQVFDGGRSFGSEKYRCSPVQPTHWMPLPAPPLPGPAEH